MLSVIIKSLRTSPKCGCCGGISDMFLYHLKQSTRQKSTAFPTTCPTTSWSLVPVTVRSRSWTCWRGALSTPFTATRWHHWLGHARTSGSRGTWLSPDPPFRSSTLYSVLFFRVLYSQLPFPGTETFLPQGEPTVRFVASYSPKLKTEENC